MTLAADGNTVFTPASDGYGHCYGPESLDEFVKRAEELYEEWGEESVWYGNLEIEVTGNHIDRANDIVSNYVG